MKEIVYVRHAYRGGLILHAEIVMSTVLSSADLEAYINAMNTKEQHY